MEPLFTDQVKVALSEVGVKYAQVGDKALLARQFPGDNISRDLLILVDEPLVTIVAPELTTVPPSRLDEVVKLANLANLLNSRVIRLGAFWVEPENRSLGFELTVPFLEGVSTGLIRLAIGWVLAPTDDFYPAFARVIWAAATAEQAFDALKTAFHDDKNEDTFGLAI